jgi:putative glycosyltransferase (TIGR04372 family)
MSKTPTPCFAGDEKNDKKIPYINISGYGSLLENKIGLHPELPENDIQFCVEKIKTISPNFFQKPFITLLLRSKAHNSIDFSNSVRNTDQKNYLRSVEFAIKNGYNVVSSGDTNSKLFKHLEGFYDFSNANIPSQLLNVFLITNCKYFIGQQSGPFTLANSSGVNCLLIDCWPYRLGSFLKGDINLYKKIYIEGEGEINLKKLFSEHQDLCLGYGYKRKKAKVIDNSEEEILESLNEFLIKTEFLEKKKLDDLLLNVPNYMHFKYAPSRPPSFVLKKL